MTDSPLLNEGKNNFLLSIFLSVAAVGLAIADYHLGEVSATYLTGKDFLSLLRNEIGAYQPAEIIINRTSSEISDVVDFAKERFSSLITDNLSRLFAYDRAKELCRRHFKEDANKLTESEMIMAAGALLSYIEETQKTDVTFARGINVYTRGQFLELDLNTIRNLELVEAMRIKSKRGSLLWVLDKTKTAMGARLLNSWVLRPLVDPVRISHRQNAVKAMFDDRRLRDELSGLLDSMLDIERLTAKAVYGTANARDLKAIGESIKNLPEIKALISMVSSPTLKNITKELDTLDDVFELLNNAIGDNPPLTVREGGMIKEGFNADVDYYRSIKDGGKDVMASIEQREKDATGIKTLKVAYNKVFGYYIEVSKSFVDQVPDRFVRKQTLTNCERYITQELKEMENTIFSADEKLVTLEYQIFDSLRAFIADNRERIRKSASLVAEIDVY